MTRILQSELLDTLPAGDADARHSRRDLRRVNAWMGHRSMLIRALRSTTPVAPRRIVELGAGDGTLALAVATRLSRHWPGVEITLVDQHHLVTPETDAAFRRLGWTPRIVQADARIWLATAAGACDVLWANLFLHHFDGTDLQSLLRRAGAASNSFVALEPRRHLTARVGCELLWLIGCNHVTRHDARLSVRAGFREHELSALWPEQAGWRLGERPAGVFSHLFTATRAPA